MHKHIVVASIPRTASTLMCEVLAQHPEVLGAGEIFCHEESGRRYYHKQAFGDVHCYEGKHDFIEYMARFEANARALGKRFCSWKLMDYQERLAWKLLEGSPEIPIIHTHRENALESCTSAAISHKCGEWHAHGRCNERAKAAAVRVSVTRQELEEWHRRKLALLDRLSHFPNPQLRIQYEDFSSDFAGTVKHVFQFLGLTEYPAKLTQLKLNPRSLRERVTNYDELETACKGTDLETYFN